jgi:outer membrane protein assembly factor BamA
MSPKSILLILLFGLPFILKGQAPSSVPDSTDQQYEPFLAFYPLVFYFPETRLGFGGAGVYNYYPGKQKSSRPSQWQVGGAYTLNKQILLYAFYQYFLRENQTEIFGEIGYYDYFYFFYGIGNETKQANEEIYFVRFPRFRIHALEEVFPNIRAGLSYKFDYYNLYEIEEEGFLDQEQPAGFEGGTISTLGLISRYDTRDNINLPTRGSLATLSFEHNAEWLGSEFTYSRLLVDVIQYIPAGEKQVIALNVYTGVMGGDPPFQELLFLGGSKKGRGIVEGRFREKAMFVGQTEYRFPLFWRFRGSVFASLGSVGTTYGQVWKNTFHLNYGVGLRFLLDPKEGIQLRVDVGFGSDTPGYYLTVGEAF